MYQSKDAGRNRVTTDTGPVEVDQMDDPTTDAEIRFA